MLTSEDVAKWTNELIDSEIESGELSNILRICDDNFELWTQKLFPILQAQGKPCYRAVVLLLHRAGCTNANEKMLGSYFTYLRKKRGLTKASGRVPLNQVQPASHVPTAVVILPPQGAAPIVPSQVAHVAVKAAVKPLTPGEQAFPHVYAKVSVTPPVDYEDFGKDLESLQVQSRSGWLDWSGTDEGYWLGFLTKIETYNKTYEPKWAVKANQVELWKYLEDKDDIAMFKLLVRKAIEKRII